MANSAAAMKKPAKGTDGQSFSVADAKAHFSEVIAAVEKRRQPITILRRGRAVARLVPMEDQPASLYGAMRGTLTEVGDIVGPTGGEWTVGGE